MKNIGTVFLHTDAQIPDERFLVLINDMLASGKQKLTNREKKIERQFLLYFIEITYFKEIIEVFLDFFFNIKKPFEKYIHDQRNR